MESLVSGDQAVLGELKTGKTTRCCAGLYEQAIGLAGIGRAIDKCPQLIGSLLRESFSRFKP